MTQKYHLGCSDVLAVFFFFFPPGELGFNGWRKPSKSVVKISKKSFEASLAEIGQVFIRQPPRLI